MFLKIIISIISALFLMIISSNLLGFFVRGLYPEKEAEQMNINFDEYKNQSRIKGMNILSAIIILIYFYAIFHFLNIGILFIALIFMAIRLPDLLWEIKHGKLITKNASKKMNKNIWYLLGSIFSLVSPILMYYFLYN